MLYNNFLLFVRNKYLGKRKADEIEREKSISNLLKDTSKN